MHNLDSKLMDNTVAGMKARNQPAIAIHDAILALPGNSGRELYVEQLNELYRNRKEVLSNYLTSIGATSRKAKLAYAKMMQLVDTLGTEELNAEVSAMK